MKQPIKQSESAAARRTIFLGPLANTVDDSAYTSTLSGADLRISKAGAAEANSAGTATHIANGLFKYEFTTGEVDTLGPISVRVAKTGLYGDVHEACVVGYDPYDSAGLGLSRIDASVSSRLAGSVYEDLDTWLDSASSIETGLTLRGFFRAAASVLFGKVSGAGTTTNVFRNAVADTKARVTSTVDTSGNRTSVTLDQT